MTAPKEKPDGWVAVAHGVPMEEVLFDSKHRGCVRVYHSKEICAMRFGRAVKQLESETAWRIRPVKLVFLDEEKTGE